MMNRSTHVVGIDLGDTRSVVAGVERATGEVLPHRRVATTPEAMDGLFAQLPANSLVALETGTHSPWIARIAERHGHTVLVAQARKLRAIWQSDRKSDDADADILCQIALASPALLSPIRHRREPAHTDLALLRLRAQVVEARTGLINSVRGTLKSLGHRAPKCSAASFHRKAAEGLPESLEGAVLPMLVAIEQLSVAIRCYDAQIERLAKDEHARATRRMLEVDGVGALTALAYVLVLDDPTRFRRSRDVGAYLGLVPRRDQSGESDRQLPISKSGDRLMRRLLVQAAHHILGPFGKDSDLRRWGLSHAERGGKSGKKRTIVAVARRLAVLLHRLWMDDRPYEPLRHAQRARADGATA